ncbi:hypothetical protein R1sor_027074 [Riccia sorocarpa]|uniref:Uncharacterized protein n=1 Tax=Riccia sorocarpa TaxID=122646 RepID=A0ABD3GGV8_9MARC
MFPSDCLTFGLQFRCIILMPLVILVAGLVLCLIVFPILEAQQLRDSNLNDMWTRVEVVRKELHRLKHASEGEGVAQTMTDGEEDQVGLQTGQEEGITDGEVSSAVQDAPSTSYAHGSIVSAADPHAASTSSGCRMRRSSTSEDQDAPSTSYASRSRLCDNETIDNFLKFMIRSCST